MWLLGSPQTMPQRADAAAGRRIQAKNFIFDDAFYRLVSAIALAELATRRDGRGKSNLFGWRSHHAQGSPRTGRGTLQPIRTLSTNWPCPSSLRQDNGTQQPAKESRFASGRKLLGGPSTQRLADAGARSLTRWAPALLFNWCWRRRPRYISLITFCGRLPKPSGILIPSILTVLRGSLVGGQVDALAR